MKLGEALSLRAKQAQKLNDLKQRVLANVLTQEGETPAEDPTELIEQYRALSDDHANLIGRIQDTNNNSFLTIPGTGAVTITAALQTREDWQRQRNLVAAAAKEATPHSDPYRFSLRTTHSELKNVSHVVVSDLREIEKKLENEITKLDATIQMANWQTDLI